MAVVAGVAYGLRCGLAVEAGLLPFEKSAAQRLVPPDPHFGQQIEGVLARLSRVEATIESHVVSKPLTPPASVSRTELTEAIDRATSRILGEVDQRFEAQRLSLATLQSMVAQTDQMLEKVLGHLESNIATDQDEDETSDLDQPLISHLSR
jgi:hypothetical protein